MRSDQVALPLRVGLVAGGNASTIAGVPPARDVLVLEAGLDVDLSPTAELGFSYNGQFGSGMIDQSLKAKLVGTFQPNRARERC